MVTKKIYWLVYTVLIGMIPIFAKLILFFSINSQSINTILNISDLVSFGLVICVSIMSELLRFELQNDNWKTVSLGIVIIFLVFYGLFFALAYLSEETNLDVNMVSLRIMTIVFVIINFFAGLTIFDRIIKRENNNVF